MAQNILNKEQLAELQDVFSRFDRDRDGSLSMMELSALLRSLDLKPESPEVLSDMLAKADVNKNGLIEFTEFADLVAPEIVRGIRYNQEDLLALFRAFDRDGNGFITAVELAQSMSRLGHTLTVRELADMIKEADTDGDGRISFTEFAEAIGSAAMENANASIGVC